MLNIEYVFDIKTTGAELWPLHNLSNVTSLKVMFDHENQMSTHSD